MSRWAKSRPWRVELDPLRRQRVAELRQQRQRPWWPRPLGFALLGCALLAAIAGDYPLPRGKAASASSAAATGELKLELLAPLGEVASRQLQFAWRWRPEGPAPAACELVLLDEQMAERCRLPVAAATAVAADGELAAALAGGVRFFWYVEATASGRHVVSPLAPLVFPR